MASIYDIAKKAGVSPSTVSLILNNKADAYRISKDTQKKVLEHAQEIGYLPNVAARQLLAGSANSTPEVAVFWEQDALWFIAKMLTKMQELVSAGQIRSMSVKIYPYTPGKLSFWKHILSSKFNNGFIISTSSREDIEFLKTVRNETPTVIVHSELDGYYSIVVDDRANAERVIDIFRASGIKSFGALIDRHDSWHMDSMRRFSSSLTSACESAGLRLSFLRHYTPEKEFSAKHLERLADAIMNNGDMPEGLYVSGASLAVNLVYALRRRGIRIPEDLKLITYGIDENTALCDPPITLLKYPIDEISEASYREMERLFRGEGSIDKTHVCKSSVLFRKSCPEPVTVS